MSKKAWIIFAAVCVAILGVLIYLSSQNKVNVDSVDTNKIVGASKDSGNIADHVLGNKDSKVVLVEYGDFQCPGCGAAHPNVKKVAEKYQGQLAFVFRNFPLSSLHPNARAAAAAAEAAGMQGKYWEMHNKLYENQSMWKDLGADKRTDFFVGYAEELGIDVNKFKTDYASDKINQKISYDQALGKKANVTATPTFYLNGKEVEQNTWKDETALDKAIADALKANGIALPQ